MMADLPNDVKPPVGPIPKASPLRPTALGENHFKVDLLVHNDTRHKRKQSTKPQRLLPFKQYRHSEGPLSIDYYVATDGLAFSIRVKLERPAAANVSYGGRVYIDSGEAYDKDVVFRFWSYPDDDNPDDAMLLDHDEEEVDTSRADHYFWFEPGQTEHVISGFYKSATRSRQFEFAAPARKRGDYTLDTIRETLHSLGIIRIVLCAVDSFKRISAEEVSILQKQRRDPSKAFVTGNGLETIDKQVKLVAKPGAVVEDGRVTTRCAILSNKIIHERRIIYNTYDGFCARNTIDLLGGKSVDFFKGMPLTALTKSNIRQQAIMTFFRDLNAGRVDQSIEKRNKTEEADEKPDLVGTNDFVRVEDIVHYICQSLSPAASYFVCTGKAKEDRRRGRDHRHYGERVVQRMGATQGEKFQDYAEKERSLVSYFQSKPGTYEVVFAATYRKRNPRKSYKVRLVVSEISDDSSDEGDDEDDE